MENLAENNKLIELLEDLYDAKYLKKEEDSKSKLDKEMEEIDNNIQTLKKCSKFNWFKKTVKEVANDYTNPNKNVIDAYYNLIDYVNKNILSKPNQDFWTLWKFCQFVRYSEKIFLYENNPEAEQRIYVDSAMKNDEEPAFTITTCKYRIFIKLQLISKPNLGLANFTESAYNQVITIMVNRNYGKKMSSKYIVIDGEVELEDDSDQYLINQINKDINYSIQNTIVDIVETLLTVSYMYNIDLRFKFENYYKGEE